MKNNESNKTREVGRPEKKCLGDFCEKCEGRLDADTCGNIISHDNAVDLYDKYHEQEKKKWCEGLLTVDEMKNISNRIADKYNTSGRINILGENFIDLAYAIHSAQAEKMAKIKGV